jgi:hypothetical protein
MSLYNLVTDNFKEYDFDTEYCLNIYIWYHASTVLFPIKKILNIDKYVICESRDMSDESGTYIILLKLKTILFTWR